MPLRTATGCGLLLRTLPRCAPGVRDRARSSASAPRVPLDDVARPPDLPAGDRRISQRPHERPRAVLFGLGERRLQIVDEPGDLARLVHAVEARCPSTHGVPRVHDDTVDGNAVLAQAAVCFHPEGRGHHLRLHVRTPSRVALGQLQIDGVVRRERDRHAAEPHHAATRPGERDEQLPREREVPECVGGKHDLGTVGGRFTAPGWMNDSGVEQNPIQRAPRPQGCRGRPDRPGLGGVDDEGFDVGSRNTPR